jgi:hypothetical protein
MLSPEEGRYNEDFKKRFRTAGMKAMKELALLLDLEEIDIHFNPAGIACSGDLRLMGMWKDGVGIYVTMNKDFPNAPWGQILYRTIKDMKDYTGGSNNFFKFSMLQFPDHMKEEIEKLHRSEIMRWEDKSFGIERTANP